MGDIKGEGHLAEAIQACLEYLKEQDITQREVAYTIEMDNPVQLNFAKNVNELNRKRFEKKWDREKILEAICTYYSLEVKVIENGFEVIPIETAASDVPFERRQNDTKEPSANLTSKYYYVYYYCENDNHRHFKIDKAKLVIEEFSNKATNAFLSFYRNNGELRVTYSGELLSTIDESTKIISFTKSVNPDIYSLLILNTHTDGFQNQIIYGTFAAIGPACGKVILEKSTEADIDGQVASKEISPIIQLSLWNQRINANEAPLQDWSDHLLSGVEQYLIALYGAYEGYVFINADQQFSKFRLFMDKNSTTFYQSPHTGEFRGYFRVIPENGILIAYYDYKEEFENYRVQIILGLPKQGEERLFGIYSGIDKNNRPMAGRCILYKAASKSLEEIDIAFLTNAQKVKNIPGLEDFFLGNNPDKPFYDSPLQILNFLRPDIYLKETKLIQNSIHKERLQNLAGTYRLYRLSTNQRNIISTALKLSPDGSFESKDHRPASSSYHGRAYIIETSILCLNIERWNTDRIYTGQLLFYVGSKNKDDFRHLHGASILLTNDPSIRCGREILVKVDEVYQKLESEIIPLPINGVDSIKFKELNEKHDNLGFFLMGDANNLIKTPRDADRRFQRIEDYGLLYFSSACYFAIKYTKNLRNEKTKEKLFFNLQKAFLHGFGLRQDDKEMINKETEKGGAFFELPNSLKSLIDWNLLKVNL